MNQRVIKFRAFDKIDKEWHYLFVVDGGVRFKHSVPFKAERVSEWQEFTGLHDKNGKEIYEGDICTFYWNPIFNEPSTLFELKASVVFYSKWSSFCFEIRKAQSSGKQLELFDELGDADLYVAVGSPITHGEKGYGVEVIGNIYENPELLA